MRKTIAVLAACTLVFAACGDDDEDSPPDTDSPETTTGDDTGTTDVEDTAVTEVEDTAMTEVDDTAMTDGGESDDSAPDADDVIESLRQQLVDLGLSEQQADCVIDRSVELGMESGGEMPSQEELLDVYEECDVDLTNLQPGS